MKLKLGVDKLYHFQAGILIYIFSSIFLSAFIAMIPVIAIGAIKELYDLKSNKGTPDIWDFIFTVLGGLTLLIFTI